MTSSSVDSDVVVIGAGPAGSMAAWEALNKNSDLSVSVFEKKQKIGYPTHCSGLIATEGLQKLGINVETIRQRLGYNRIHRAKFIAPNYKSFEIIREVDSMVVVDRVALDCYLAERAEKIGCRYNLEHKISQIKFNGAKWNLLVKHGNKESLHNCRILICAEGVPARLGGSIGLPIPKTKWLFPALQYEFKGVSDLDLNCVEIYFGRNIAPGFFGWIIPITDESARIGIAVSRIFSGKTRQFMNHFINKHPLLKQRLSDSHVTKRNGGLVPVSGPIKRTYQANLMIVGDAAGQTKATTGGGVNIGGFCGRLAGMTSRKIITENINPSKGCRDYELLWKAYFEPDLSLMKYFRRMLTPLQDKAWNRIIEIARDTELGSSLKTSTIDLHGLALLKYSFNPRILIKSLNLIPQAAVSFLQGLFI